jgi:hypothetical protein
MIEWLSRGLFIPGASSGLWIDDTTSFVVASVRSLRSAPSRVRKGGRSCEQ